MDFKNPSTIMKLVEMVLTVIILIVESTEKNFALYSNVATMQVAYGGLVLGFVVSGVLLVVFLQGGRTKIQTTPFEMMVTAVSGLLLLSAGAVLVDKVKDLPDKIFDTKSALASGSLCIVAAAAYFVDTFFAVRAVRACRANAQCR